VCADALFDVALRDDALVIIIVVVVIVVTIVVAVASAPHNAVPRYAEVCRIECCSLIQTFVTRARRERRDAAIAGVRAHRACNPILPDVESIERPNARAR
jgi:hypothetical protein